MPLPDWSPADRLPIRTTRPQLLETQLGPSSKVYALDNPGVGTESTRHAPCSLPETVDDLLQRFQAARDADRRTGPWLAAGVSLGGMLALEIAGRGVPSCGGVVVANSSCTHLSWSWERLRPMAFFAMLHALAKCDLEEKERIMIPFTIHDQKRQQQSHEARLHIARHRPLPMRTFVAQCIGACAHCTADTLRESRVSDPVHVPSGILLAPAKGLPGAPPRAVLRHRPPGAGVLLPRHRGALRRHAGLPPDGGARHYLRRSRMGMRAGGQVAGHRRGKRHAQRVCCLTCRWCDNTY